MTIPGRSAAAVCALLVLGLLSGCASGSVSAESAAPTPSREQPDPCLQRARELPVRARLGQRLMVDVDPTGTAEALAAARAGVGGVFVGGDATALLTGDALPRVQAAASIPVAVAVDDEGGRVQRIDALDGALPSARQMASTMSPAQVQRIAAERGRELRSHGVTVDFAPVVDLGSQPADAVIGDRSFGADPNTATSYAAAFAAGLREAGVVPVLKHFPGHGRASGDSHRGLATTPPLAELRAADLVPYQRLAGDRSLAIMVGDLDVPGLTGGEPATLSPAAYQLLRGEYRHTGLIITDDLGAMRAVSDRYELPAAILRALQAGADVALWTTRGRLSEVLDRLEAALASGQLDGAELDRSVGRVLAAKGAC